MNTKFEEKTYESYFNSELDRKSEIYFPPGQVVEGYLGFDSSAFSHDELLWTLLTNDGKNRNKYKGADLFEIAGIFEDRFKNYFDRIPSMKANLILQYKKPEYMLNAGSKEWHLWNEPYFRYDIYYDQQKILEEIDQNFSDDVLIVYASPAIMNMQELVDLKIQNRIIESSNFRKASELNGHHRNTYTRSGLISIACSEPEEFQNLDLIRELERLETNSYRDNYSFITNFGAKMNSILLENEYYGDSFRKVFRGREEFLKYRIITTFITMKIFRELSGIQWMIVR